MGKPGLAVRWTLRGSIGLALCLASSAQAGADRWSMVAAARQADPGWIRHDPASWLDGHPWSRSTFADAAFSVVPHSALAPSAKPVRRPPPQGTRGPDARADWFYFQRAYPLAKVPVGARQRALAEAEKVAEAPGRNKAGSNSPWTLMGPTGFDSRIEPTWGRMSGRVRALAIDPTISSRLLLGTATGGVWLSANSGASWMPLTDNQPSLAIGAVAIDPNNPNVFYAGTGEANGSYYSAGILKSTNSGASWSVLGASVFNRGAIAGIAINPANSNNLLVCARSGKDQGSNSTVGDSVGGIYRSTDGGQNWTQIVGAQCKDFAVVPTDFNTMYFVATGVGADGGLYKSTDAGQNWSRVAGAVTGNDIERLAIGLSNQGTRVWLAGSKGGQVVIQRSTDSGATWTTLAATDIPESVDQASYQLYCESQCDYDNAVAVNPFDANEAWLAGVGAFRTRDGGNTFTQYGSNNAGGGPLHVDHHLVLFDRRQQGVVYDANDGGIYRSSDGGTTWTSIGGTLATIQSYNIALHPSNRNIIFTGNQDNGTTRRSDSNVW
ncbi:MAG: hypothetical protein JNL89_14030, partial [Rhodanobacteraceae bacterium]|nr:hypothetical protein [Rhodanobacteraceae bacterium]